MSALLTSLLLFAYGTAAFVGMYMIAGSVFRLTGTGRVRHGLVHESLTVAGSVVVLVAGLFLAVQGAVVYLWTLS